MKNHLYLMKRICIAFTFSFLLVSIVSCGKKERVINSTECHPNQAALRTATNETGTFGYDETIKLNTITVATANVTAVYLLCNPPITLPAVGANVTFSGTVRASSFSAVGTKTYYEITVTSLQ